MFGDPRANAIIEYCRSKGTESTHLPIDHEFTNANMIYQDWIAWNLRYSGFGKEMSYNKFIRILDIEFLKYDQFTRECICRRMITYLSDFLFHHEEVTGDGHLRDCSSCPFIYDNAIDELTYFTEDFINFSLDFNISIYELCDDERLKKGICYILNEDYPKEDNPRNITQLANVISHPDKESIIRHIKEQYSGAKGKDIAILLLALKECGAVSVSSRARFYRAFLHDVKNSSPIESFRKGVDKYLNKQGKLNDDEWITNTIKRDEVTPVIERLSSQK